jgi:Carboxypeptidase regulatory-like domain
MIACLVVTLLLAQAVPVAKTVRVEGTVVSATTGDPLRKASVELRSTAVNRVSSAGNYISTTDAEGRFLFEEVQPGSYTLHAERVGYVSQKVLTNGPVSTLKFIAGQKLTDLAIKLTPQGAIYGRIVDEDGDPVRDADINLMRWSYRNGKKELRSIENSGLSVNDDGTFMIGYLPPGRYYAKAVHGMRRSAQPGSKSEPQDWYVPTYFPSAIDPAGAAPIDILPGIEQRGVQIQLRKMRVFTVRGKAIVNLAGPVQNLIVRLFPVAGISAASKSVDNDGIFEFNNILPGTYFVEAITTSITSMTDRATGDVTRQPPITGRTFVTVTDGNVDGIVLNVNPGIEFTGKLKLDDAQAQSPSTLPANLKVRFERQGSPFESDQFKSDGTFRIRGIAPDEYRVRVMGMPADTYIKSVKAGDRDVTHKKIDVSAGLTGEIEIMLSPNACDLAGIVRNSNGDLAADITIQLTRDDDDAVISPATSDQTGGFRFRSLAPGDYRIYAWQDDGDGIIIDPEFRKRFDGQSSKIKLSEKSHENIELKLITKDSMDAEAAKMP